MMVDSMLIVYAAILYFAGIVVSIFAYKNTIKAARNQFALEELNMQLAELSMTDDLTDLSNRVALKTNLAKFYHNELNLMMIDIDNFKKLNDTYGHQVGDDYIIKIAECLQGLRLHGNVFCARYGGDEFVIIYMNYQEDEVLKIANELKRSVEKKALPHPEDAGNVVTISHGIIYVRRIIISIK